MLKRTGLFTIKVHAQLQKIKSQEMGKSLKYLQFFIFLDCIANLAMIQDDAFKTGGVLLRVVNKEAIHLNILPSSNSSASLQNTT